MTPEQLWKLAFRTCEAKIRKNGPVFSEAEIMAEFPGVGLVGDGAFPMVVNFSGGEPFNFNMDDEPLNIVVKEYKCPTK